MNACEMFYDPSKSVLQIIQMLKNACKCRCETYECVGNETRTQNMGNHSQNTHCGCFSLSYICQALSNFNSLFSNKFKLIVHIRPAFYGNVNMNARESLQMPYDHYKCLAINKNGLRLLTNMLLLLIAIDII